MGVVFGVSPGMTPLGVCTTLPQLLEEGSAMGGVVVLGGVVLGVYPEKWSFLAIFVKTESKQG